MQPPRVMDTPRSTTTPLCCEPCALVRLSSSRARVVPSATRVGVAAVAKRASRCGVDARCATRRGFRRIARPQVFTRPTPPPKRYAPAKRAVKPCERDGKTSWTEGERPTVTRMICLLRHDSARDAVEGKGPRRRPQKRLDRRLEEVAKAVGGGYCRLQMPLRLALGVRGTVAGRRLGALERGGGGGVTSPTSNAFLDTASSLVFSPERPTVDPY